MKTLKCLYPFPVLVATYAGGRTARFSFFQVKGKPWDWSRAQRVASHLRFTRDGQPAFPVTLAIEHDGAIYRPGDTIAKPARKPTARDLSTLIGQYLNGTASRADLGAAIQTGRF